MLPKVRRPKSGGDLRGRSIFLATGFASLPTTALAAPLAAPTDVLVLPAIATGALALAVAAALWALAEQRATRALHRDLEIGRARSRAAIGERDALIDAGRESLVVWARDRDYVGSYSGGDALIDSCLAGEDATALSQALDALSAHGTAFTMSARDKSGRQVQLRGRAVGGMAAVWLSPEPSAATGSSEFRTL